MTERAPAEFLTLQQAADVLNTHDGWIRKLVDEGTFEAVLIDGEERLRREDVLAYKVVRDARRRAGLKKLVRLTEELGLYEHQRERSLEDEKLRTPKRRQELQARRLATRSGCGRRWAGRGRRWRPSSG